ncbi:MAG TPA: helix-turn-helix domain-containing protein [Allosphingosinicella sp.]|jgi:transcriptional regulator GlxA family with amidase domain
MARRIGILAFPGVNALDLSGPAEVFTTANEQAPGTRPYEVAISCLGGGSVRCEAGFLLGGSPDADDGDFDTIIVPGGAGLRESEINRAAADWILARARKARRVVSVCTGIYALAETGLLDGRRATSHWRFCTGLSRLYPQIRFEPDAIFIRDGRFYTSAGITAAIDLSLALVEEDLGPSAALAVARELVVYLKRPGGQLQYSEPLRFQARASDRFADLAAWLPANLAADLSIEALAARAHLGRRQFGRAFKASFGATPAEYVESLRLGEAVRLLATGRQPVDSIAAAIGYAGADAFRHAFERRYGVAPSIYRARFAPSAKGEAA